MLVFTISGQQKDRKGSYLQVRANFHGALAFQRHQRLCCNEPPISLQCILCYKISNILPNLIVLNPCKNPGEDGVNPNQGSSKQWREELNQPLKVSGGLSPRSTRQSPLAPPEPPLPSCSGDGDLTRAMGTFLGAAGAPPSAAALLAGGGDTPNLRYGRS